MSRPDPFFIVGTGRSGTTLIQRMLSAHPGITIPPETQFFSRFDPAIRFTDPLREREVGAYLARVGDDPWWGELGLSVDALRAHVEGGGRDARSILWWMLRGLSQGVEDRVRFGEKTPHHEKRVARIAGLFPRARFIHIVRDPRDVVVSLRREAWWPWRSVQRTARSVRGTLHRQLHNERALGERYLRVRYESLVEDPEGELRRVCAFLGEDFDPVILRYHESESAGFLASERAWKGLSTQPLDPSRIGRWRERLSARQASCVDRWVGRGLLEEYGYERCGRARMPWAGVADAGERTWWFASRQLRSVRKRLA
ncbi:MAG: sulfotransferase [Planctomycetota bacterium]